MNFEAKVKNRKSRNSLSARLTFKHIRQGETKRFTTVCSYRESRSNRTNRVGLLIRSVLDTLPILLNSPNESFAFRLFAEHTHDYEMCLANSSKNTCLLLQ
jgi:hypothetical protein